MAGSNIGVLSLFYVGCSSENYSHWCWNVQENIGSGASKWLITPWATCTAGIKLMMGC